MTAVIGNMRVIEWPETMRATCELFAGLRWHPSQLTYLYYQNAKRSVPGARPHSLILTQKDV